MSSEQHQGGTEVVASQDATTSGGHRCCGIRPSMGLASSRVVQLAPFQLSEKDSNPLLVWKLPTARQARGEAHDTPLRFVGLTPLNGIGDTFCQRIEKSSASARSPLTGSW